MLYSSLAHQKITESPSITLKEAIEYLKAHPAGFTTPTILYGDYILQLRVSPIKHCIIIEDSTGMCEKWLNTLDIVGIYYRHFYTGECKRKDIPKRGATGIFDLLTVIAIRAGLGLRVENVTSFAFMSYLVNNLEFQPERKCLNVIENIDLRVSHVIRWGGG